MNSPVLNSPASNSPAFDEAVSNAHISSDLVSNDASSAGSVSTLRGSDSLISSDPASTVIANEAEAAAFEDDGAGPEASAPVPQAGRGGGSGPGGSAVLAGSNPASTAAPDISGLVASGLTASALTASGVNAPVLTAQAEQASSPAAVSPDANILAQNDLSAATVPDPLAALKNQLVAAGHILSTSAQLATAGVERRTVAGKPATAAPSTSQTPASTTSSESASSGAANQSAFSVFFSDSQPGTQSAASTLPKMILPAANSATLERHIAGGNGPGTGQAASGQSAAQASGAAPAPAGTDSTGSGTGSLQTAAALRHEAELAASAQNNPDSGQSSGANPGANPGQSPAAASPVLTATLSPAAPEAPALPKSAQPPSQPQSPPEPPLSVSGENLLPGAQGPVQMAQMMSSAGQSEMRIGMSTSAFGSVEVRTTVHASDVGLVIGSEKGDLRTLMANDLPAIANTLQQQSLRLNSVNFMQGFAFSNDASGGGNSQQQPFVPMRAPLHAAAPDRTRNDFAEAPPGAGFGGEAGSLSILA
ncbi:MAG: flagellar hook-length control protein FliK [Candidatus Sulfotelmatobacter sp.]